MARKQARRRKQKKARNFRMPSIPIARIVTPAVAILIVVATYQVSGKLLDRFSPTKCQNYIANAGHLRSA